MFDRDSCLVACVYITLYRKQTEDMLRMMVPHHSEALKQISFLAYILLACKCTYINVDSIDVIVGTRGTRC